MYLGYVWSFRRTQLFIIKKLISPFHRYLTTLIFIKFIVVFLFQFWAPIPKMFGPKHSKKEVIKLQSRSFSTYKIRLIIFGSNNWYHYNQGSINSPDGILLIFSMSSSLVGNSILSIPFAYGRGDILHSTKNARFWNSMKASALREKNILSLDNEELLLPEIQKYFWRLI
jgi:hypothetical protein